VTADIKLAQVDKDCMRDPLNDSFFEDTWRLIADNNTKIFRRVFRCNPDSEVTNWHEYTEFVAYADKFAQSQGVRSTEHEQQEATGKSGPPGATMPGAGSGVVGQGLSSIAEKVNTLTGDNHHPKGTATDCAEDASKGPPRLELNTDHVQMNGQLDGIDEKAEMRRSNEAPSPTQPAGNEAFPSLESTLSPPQTDAEKASEHSTRRVTVSSAAPSDKPSSNQPSVKKRRRGTTKGSRKGFAASDGLLSSQDVDELLSMVQGHLVVFPYDWLIKEELNSNWLYQVDQVAPLQI
jgi:phospholipase D1/2